MSYYSKHLFFCTNRRLGGQRPCCEDCGASAMRQYAKSRIKTMGLAGPGGVRVNTAGCLDRCEEGPVLVIYPDGVWYTYVDEEDIDEIIDEHVIAGRPVARLRLSSE